MCTRWKNTKKLQKNWAIAGSNERVIVIVASCYSNYCIILIERAMRAAPYMWTSRACCVILRVKYFQIVFLLVQKKNILPYYEFVLAQKVFWFFPFSGNFSILYIPHLYSYTRPRNAVKITKLFSAYQTKILKKKVANSPLRCC